MLVTEAEGIGSGQRGSSGGEYSLHRADTASSSTSSSTASVSFWCA